jgi:hypothetical protein
MRIIRPLPQTLMGIDDYRIFERFLLEIDVRPRADVVTVQIIEMTSLTDVKIHAHETVGLGRRANYVMQSSAGDPELTEQACPDYLNETAWTRAGAEGFGCVLDPGHDGPHVARTWVQAEFAGVDERGRRYRWAHVWEYLDPEPQCSNPGDQEHDHRMCEDAIAEVNGG